VQDAGGIAVLGRLWERLDGEAPGHREWRKAIAKEAATVLRRAEAADPRRQAVLALLRADFVAHRERGCPAPESGLPRQASLLHHVVTAFSAPTAREQVVAALNLSVLPGFFSWYDAEEARYEGQDTLLLRATLHQCMAILCERLTAEFTASPGEYHLYQDILDGLERVLRVIPAGEREPYYWRLFGHIREALSYAELATRAAANETGGARDFLAWAERYLASLLEHPEGGASETPLHPDFVRLVWTSLLGMPNPRRFFRPLAVWAAAQARPLVAAAQIASGMTPEDERHFASEMARALA